MCFRFCFSALIFFLSLILCVQAACVSPSDDSENWYVSDTVLCTDTYNRVTLVLDADGIVLDCNGSILDGLWDGEQQEGVIVMADSTTVINCDFRNYESGYSLQESDSSEKMDYVLNSTFYNNTYGIDVTVINYGIHVENSSFHHNNVGLDFGTTTNVTVVLNNFTGNLHAAVKDNYVMKWSRINNNRFSDHNRSSTVNVVDIDQFEESEFKNNYFINQNGTALLLSTSSVASELVIENNTIINVYEGDALAVYSMRDGIIRGNTLINSTHTAIRSGGLNPTNNLIENNTIVNLLPVDNYAYGIYLNKDFNTTIRNNHVFGYTYPIMLYDKSNYCVAYNNIINDTTQQVRSRNQTNSWNTSRDCTKTNIAGGPCVGGNLFLNNDSSGFSQTCADDDNDGFCDDPYTDSSVGWEVTDYLALTEDYNYAPTLTLGSVSPELDSTGSTFTFTVTYSDADGDASSYVRLVLDGGEHVMSKQSGEFDSGAVYSVEPTINDYGTHTYYFTSSDGTTTTDTSTVTKPHVTSNSDCSVTDPPVAGDWEISSSETCQDSAFLASSTGDLCVKDSNTLTVDGATIYINQSKLNFEGSSKITLTNGILTFM
ncbi:MAG: hypothetical protein GF334_06015 [Candidatus Altiarchaeales archaeon]|nr:hypothetical protein [Candidatus Altiarchaeales archaeon]